MSVVTRKALELINEEYSVPASHSCKKFSTRKDLRIGLVLFESPPIQSYIWFISFSFDSVFLPFVKLEDYDISSNSRVY